jgi:hypothetical protein
MTEWVWLGLAGIACGLPFSILMDWLRDRHGWPAEDSILRWEVWMLLGLGGICLGIMTLMAGVVGFWLQ